MAVRVAAICARTVGAQMADTRSAMTIKEHTLLLAPLILTPMGLVPAICARTAGARMAGTRPAMTFGGNAVLRQAFILMPLGTNLALTTRQWRRIKIRPPPPSDYAALSADCATPGGGTVAAALASAAMRASARFRLAAMRRSCRCFS
jgi:hypothetical protein